MIQEVKMFSIVCDSCKETFIESETGFGAFTDECSARTAALNEEWAEINSKHYCPNCYHFNDELDDYIPNNTNMSKT